VKKHFFSKLAVTLLALGALWHFGFQYEHAVGENDLNYATALRRIQYLLHGNLPSSQEFSVHAASEGAYRSRVRSLLEDERIYNALLRYHEKSFGVGLPSEYLEELLRDDIDFKSNKLAQITCNREGVGTPTSRLRCYWSSADQKNGSMTCPVSDEITASVFWYQGVVAWVCPSVARTCGADLSRCFVSYEDQDLARNSEIGATEAFDTRYSVIKSLGRQSAGLATRIVMEDYPYNKILSSGLTAIDGAIAHFYRQTNHFDLAKLNLSPEILSMINDIQLTDTRYRLVNAGSSYEQAGVISTFGWLRRYEKNRTRANQLYERLLCRKFTAELPKVFPQDPGNLRETEGCKGCHATLDPLSDFFNSWGEGGELYSGFHETKSTSFAGKTGASLADLAGIVSADPAFATCTVQHAWEWLMGREFYTDEANLRAALSAYFTQTDFNFKELLYAIATHPAFAAVARSDAVVGDPLAEPPLGTLPSASEERECPTTAVTFAKDIEPHIGLCTNCHGANATARQKLVTIDQWKSWGNQAAKMMASGNMPPGQAGPPRIGAVYDLKESLRCWIAQESQE
jgi:hypothetical protein